MNNFSKIIDKFKNLKILVVGDLMLDQYIHGDVNRISPEAPIPILDVKRIVSTPGGAANAAFNVKCLGAQVILSGVIGPGQRGKTLKKALEERGIQIQGLVVDEARKTTLKERIVAKNQQIVRVDIEDRKSIDSQTETKIIEFLNSIIKDLDAIIISDYAKGMITPNLSMNIIKMARENNILCTIDPKGKEFAKYKGCDLITPNVEETILALNLEKKSLKDENKFLQAGEMLLSHVMCDNVLITQHSKGMTLFTKEGKIIKYSAVNNKVLDVSGAGDTAIAALTLSLASNANLKEAMAIASHACGVVVGKSGTAATSTEELKQSIKNIDVSSKD